MTLSREGALPGRQAQLRQEPLPRGDASGSLSEPVEEWLLAISETVESKPMLFTTCFHALFRLRILAIFILRILRFYYPAPPPVPPPAAPAVAPVDPATDETVVSPELASAFMLAATSAGLEV